MVGCDQEAIKCPVDDRLGGPCLDLSCLVSLALWHAWRSLTPPLGRNAEGKLEPDNDLAGPILIALMLGASMMLRGKVDTTVHPQLTYIYMLLSFSRRCNAASFP